MADMIVVVTPLMFHVGFFWGVEMVSGADRHGRGYSVTALKTKEHAVGLVAALMAAGLLTFGNPGNALVVSLAFGALLLLDVFMLFRAFKAAKVGRKGKG